MLEKIYGQIADRARTKPSTVARVLSEFYLLQQELCTKAGVSEVDDMRAKIGQVAKLLKEQRELEDDE